MKVHVLLITADNCAWSPVQDERKPVRLQLKRTTKQLPQLKLPSCQPLLIVCYRWSIKYKSQALRVSSMLAIWLLHAVAERCLLSVQNYKGLTPAVLLIKERNFCVVNSLVPRFTPLSVAWRTSKCWLIFCKILLWARYYWSEPFLPSVTQHTTLRLIQIYAPESSSARRLRIKYLFNNFNK